MNSFHHSCDAKPSSQEPGPEPAKDAGHVPRPCPHRCPQRQKSCCRAHRLSPWWEQQDDCMNPSCQPPPVAIGNPYFTPISPAMAFPQSGCAPVPVSPSASVNCCQIFPRLPLAFPANRYCFPPAPFQKPDEEDKLKQSSKETCPRHSGFNSPCVMLCGSQNCQSPCAPMCPPPILCPPFCQPTCPPPCCPPMPPMCPPLCPSPCGSACTLPCQAPCDGACSPICRTLCPSLRPLMSSMCKPPCCPSVCPSFNSCCPPMCPKFCPPMCPSLCPPMCPLPQSNLCPPLCMPAFTPPVANSQAKILSDPPIKPSDGASAGGKTSSKSGGLTANGDPNCCSFDHLCSRVGYKIDSLKNIQNQLFCDPCHLCVKILQNVLSPCDLCEQVFKCAKKGDDNRNDIVPVRGREVVLVNVNNKRQVAKQDPGSELGPEGPVCKDCPQLLSGTVLDNNLRACLCENCAQRYSKLIRSYLQSAIHVDSSDNDRRLPSQSINRNRVYNNVEGSSQPGDGTRGCADVSIIGGSERDGARVKFSGLEDGGGTGGGGGGGRSDGAHSSGGVDGSGSDRVKRTSISHSDRPDEGQAPESRGGRPGKLCPLCFCGQGSCHCLSLLEAAHVAGTEGIRPDGGVCYRSGPQENDCKGFGFHTFKSYRLGEPTREVPPIVLERLISEIKSLYLQGDADMFYKPGEGELYHRKGEVECCGTTVPQNKTTAIDWQSEPKDHCQQSASKRPSIATKSSCSQECSQTNATPSRQRCRSSKTKVTFCQHGEDESVGTEAATSEELCGMSSVTSVDISPGEAQISSTSGTQVACTTEETACCRPCSTEEANQEPSEGRLPLIRIVECRSRHSETQVQFTERTEFGCQYSEKADCVHEEETCSENAHDPRPIIDCKEPVHGYTDREDAATQENNCGSKYETNTVLAPGEAECQCSSEVQIQFGKDDAGCQQEAEHIHFAPKGGSLRRPSDGEDCCRRCSITKTTCIREEILPCRCITEKADQHTATAEAFTQRSECRHQFRPRVLVIPGEAKHLKSAKSESPAREMPRHTPYPRKAFASSPYPRGIAAIDDDEFGAPCEGELTEKENPCSSYRKEEIPSVTVSPPYVEGDRGTTSVQGEKLYELCTSETEFSQREAYCRCTKDIAPPVHGKALHIQSKSKSLPDRGTTSSECCLPRNSQLEEKQCPARGEMNTSTNEGEKLCCCDGALCRLPHPQDTPSCHENPKTHCSTDAKPHTQGEPLHSQSDCATTRTPQIKASNMKVCEHNNETVQASCERRVRIDPEPQVPETQCTSTYQIERCDTCIQEKSCDHPCERGHHSKNGASQYDGYLHAEEATKNNGSLHPHMSLSQTTLYNPFLGNPGESCKEPAVCSPISEARSLRSQGKEPQQGFNQVKTSPSYCQRDIHPCEKLQRVRSPSCAPVAHRRMAIPCFGEESMRYLPRMKVSSSQELHGYTDSETEVIYSCGQSSWPRTFDTERLDSETKFSSTECPSIAESPKTASCQSVPGYCCCPCNDISDTPEIPIECCPHQQKNEKADTCQNPTTGLSSTQSAGAYYGPTALKKEVKRCASQMTCGNVLPHDGKPAACPLADDSSICVRKSILISKTPRSSTNSLPHPTQGKSAHRSHCKSKSSHRSKRSDCQHEKAFPVDTDSRADVLYTLQEASKYFFSQMIGEKIPGPVGPLKFWCSDKFCANSTERSASTLAEKSRCKNATEEGSVGTHRGDTPHGHSTEAPDCRKEQSTNNLCHVEKETTSTSEFESDPAWQCCCPRACCCSCPCCGRRPESRRYRQRNEKCTSSKDSICRKPCNKY